MSPQRDDVPALTHALAHNFRLFGRLFCEQFVLFSILQLVQQIRVLSINCILPLCHFVRICTHSYTHSCTFVARLPSQNDKNLVLSFVIYYCRWSHHFMTSLPLAILPLRVLYLFRLLSLSLFSWPLCLFQCLCLFRCISLFFSSPPPSPVSPSAHACPAFVTGLVSITTATFLSCLTIFNQKRRKTEMEWDRERENIWKVRLLRWWIGWMKKQCTLKKR